MLRKLILVSVGKKIIIRKMTEGAMQISFSYFLIKCEIICVKEIGLLAK